MSIATLAPEKLVMHDLTGYKRIETLLNNGLTPRHTIRQAVEYYLEHAQIKRNGLDFMAFSRGVRLDNKLRIEDLPVEDKQDWMVMPEVTAG
jgi:hypothetical protein